jgi:hypothetical protein
MMRGQRDTTSTPRQLMRPHPPQHFRSQACRPSYLSQPLVLLSTTT